MTATEVTTTKPLSTDELTKIADVIRARIRRTVDDIIATGQDLTTVKDQLEHGEFLDWIKSEFQRSPRTAQRYISAAVWAEGKSDTVSHLSPSKLYLLAAPSTVISSRGRRSIRCGHEPTEPTAGAASGRRPHFITVPTHTDGPARPSRNLLGDTPP